MNWMTCDPQTALQEAYLMEHFRILGLPEEAMGQLIADAKEVLMRPELMDIIMSSYGRTKWDIPCPQDAPCLIQLLALLSRLPALKHAYAEHSIPQEVFAATMGAVGSSVQTYRRKHDAWGYDMFFWYRLYFDMNLFQLGDMQFVYQPCHIPMTLYRHRVSGEIIVFSQPNISYRKDGYANDVGDIHEDDCWVSTLIESGDQVTGYVIQEDCRVWNCPSTVSLHEYEKVLEPGDPVLDMHLPGRTKLTQQSVKNSIALAHKFYAEYFPEYQHKALTCYSWLLSPMNAALLPEDSNIVGYMRMFRKQIAPGSTAAEHFKYLYPDGYSENLEELPQRTTLQKAFVQYLKDGKFIADAGGVILLGSDEI